MDEERGVSATASVLTERERAVLQMVAEGRSNKEMAERLVLSAKTVEHHRAHVMEKLGVRDVAGLTRVAIRQGLVPLD
jgi:DNA-binding NarL/FixJ family response regulator